MVLESVWLILSDIIAGVGSQYGGEMGIQAMLRALGSMRT